MKTVTPNQVLACMLEPNQPGKQMKILDGHPFVFVYHCGRLTVELVEGKRTECGVDGCIEKGVQYGRCWKHAE